MESQVNLLYGDEPEITMDIGNYSDACRLVYEYHYSHNMPTSLCMVLNVLAYENGIPFASCSFGYGVGRWGNNGGQDARGGVQLLELVRLVKSPNSPSFHLSSLVSYGISRIKETRKHDLVISYADPTQDHHGGIYQACSWLYHGVTSTPKLKVTVDGREYNTRTLGHLARNAKLMHVLPRETRWAMLFPNKKITIEKQPCKHIYWKPLNRRGRKTGAELGLCDRPYPKPKREHEGDTG